MHNIQQDSDTSDQECYVVRTETLNFHCIQSVLITKLRNKTSQSMAELRLQNTQAVMAT